MQLYFFIFYIRNLYSSLLDNKKYILNYLYPSFPWCHEINKGCHSPGGASTHPLAEVAHLILVLHHSGNVHMHPVVTCDKFLKMLIDVNAWWHYSLQVHLGIYSWYNVVLKIYIVVNSFSVRGNDTCQPPDAGQFKKKKKLRVLNHYIMAWKQ